MELTDLPTGKKIILFDGVCNLCDSFVQYVIRRDKKDVFRFLPLQSELGKKILAHMGVDPDKMDSIVLYDPGVAYYHKSTAALEIGRHLGGLPALAIGFKILPKSLRDSVYDFVARNRYKWYGQKDECMIPTPEVRGKFLAF